MKKILTLIWLMMFILLNFISASCSDGQININSASLEDLDKLSGIGPVKAQAIIDTRPFDKLDDLIDVVGIGEVTLANIKTQGLACVTGEQENEEDDEDEEKETQQEQQDEDEDKNEEDTEDEEEEDKEEDTEEEDEEEQETRIKTTEEEKINPIILAPLTTKDIKSEINKEGVSKNKLSFYGLVTFCILLLFLWLMKKRKNEKTEFK